MDTNNWRPTQGAESTMDTNDWRAQLPHESRHRIVNKIMDTLKRHLPVSGQEGLHELRKIAQRFEEKIYTAATSQSDYLRKISLKMLTMETKSQNPIANSMPSNPGANSNKPLDPVLHQIQSIQQSQSQVTQVPTHENQMNSQLQSNLQGSVTTIQQNNMTNLQHNSMSSISGLPTAQPNMMNSMQSGANLDSVQGNSVNSLQQVAVSSLQQNPVSMPQLSNINTLTSQGGVNVLQPNLNPLQPASSMLQHQQLKQQQEQMLQNQQLKQFLQRQIQQQQYMQQRQQMLQQQPQLQQPSKQQMPAQLQTHQMSQLHQMNEMNDIKRQGMSTKPVQQHLAPGQRPAYPRQQLKLGGPFPVSSAQLLQATSPQIPQHSSPQLYKKFVCNPSPSGVCTSMGRLLHEHYNQMMAATNMSDTLSQNSPFLVSVADCSIVEETLGEVSKKRCPRLSLFSSMVYIGMLLVMVAVMFSVVLWFYG